MKKIILSSLSLAVAGLAANAQTIHQWNFDDISGTDLGAAADSVGSLTYSSFMDGNPGEFDTNGSGQIVGTGNRSGNANLTDLSSGIYQFDLSGITFANVGGGTDDAIGFGFRTQPSTSINNPARFGTAGGTENRYSAVIAFGNQDNATGVDVQVYNDTNIQSLLTNQASFSDTLDFRIIWDFDNDTVDYQMQVNGGGYSNLIVQQANTGTGEMLSLGASVFASTGESISINQATLTQVPEPSAYAFLTGLLALGWIAVRRRR